jgi:hypothetical protein
MAFFPIRYLLFAPKDGNRHPESIIPAPVAFGNTGIMDSGFARLRAPE